MAATYDIRDVVRCAASFTNTASAYIDPTSVAFLVRDPVGGSSSYTYPTHSNLVRAAQGQFYVDLTVNAEGTWRYRFESTGTGAAGGEDVFVVRNSAFT